MTDDRQTYGDFAYVYDELMDTVPYEEWCEAIIRFMDTHGISRPDRRVKEISEKNLVVDLGCGTGTLTQLLRQKGYDMIGVDSSSEMLTIAARKQKSPDILYLHQDMRELELYSTVGTIVCVCDSLNYILEEQELLSIFKLVNNYLYPNGLFICDFNTSYKYEQTIGNTTIAENREEVSFIWENYYDYATFINEYDLTVFIKEEDGRFRRFTETHYQRGYTVEQMETLIEKAGLKIVEMVDGDTWGKIRTESERVFLVAKEYRKFRS